MIRVIQDKNAQDFLSHATPLLYAKEAEYGLMLGLCEGLASGSIKNEFSPVFLRVVDDYGKTSAALVQTRKDNCIVTSANFDEAKAFADFVVENKLYFEGVVGPTETSKTITESYGQKVNSKIRVGMAQNIMQFTKTDWPQKISGNFEIATESDFDLIADWLMAFAREALPHDNADEAHFRKIAEAKIKKQEAFLWIENGVKKAMTLSGRPTKNGVSVSGVYTPKSERRKGYASNLVASVSDHLIRQGKSFCVLYTDAANPTSNKIYQNIGYKIIGESSHYILTRD